ncbi:hypothetical protein [Bradyrhizobium neotropicale]|uniref:hypothetical protein n=1 Tax=Bradyrhizobium neotropicale TaxID=1497615 RepID=UPI001AD732A2|nr:hypothetical protein [Bradyrhizobium neotropicale]MBO4222228.1 hypothetical protein [Bradyrhizobium neotropicale]
MITIQATMFARMMRFLNLRPKGSSRFVSGQSKRAAINGASLENFSETSGCLVKAVSPCCGLAIIDKPPIEMIASGSVRLAV